MLKKIVIEYGSSEDDSEIFMTYDHLVQNSPISR